MILLVLHALATEGVDEVPPDAALPGWRVGETAPFDVRTTIETAIRLRTEGDLPGATTLLAGVSDLVGPELRNWYEYQRGINEELAWHFAEARTWYERVIERGGEHVPDARFRLALVLEDLGETEAAAAQMRELARLKGLDESDVLTLALQGGITDIHNGRVRRGTRALTEALAATEGGPTHTWLRAKARYTLARQSLAEADATSLTGSQRRLVRRLKARIALIDAATAEIVRVVNTPGPEPEWILASLLALGESYRRLGDDLAAAPPPASLSAEEQARYHELLRPYVENAYTKAWHYWDEGLAMAGRLGFESPKVQTLKERSNALPR